MMGESQSPLFFVFGNHIRTDILQLMPLCHYIPVWQLVNLDHYIDIYKHTYLNHFGSLE